MAEPIVVGIDGGGTTTRAAAADLHGTILAIAETGGCNPQHTPDAEANVRNAIELVLGRSGRTPGDVIAVVAGLAGLDSPKDLEWAERSTAVSGLTCLPEQVNDAVVAHAGALRGEPGIIAISGTGCIVFGVTESGRAVRNYDFAQYARTSSQWLGYEAVFRIIAGDAGPDDGALVNGVLRHCDQPDVKSLATYASQFSREDRYARNYRMGALAPHVTTAAGEGSPLAQSICDHAAFELALAIRLVGSCFALPEAPVVLIGGAARSPYMSTAIEQCLISSAEPTLRIREPALSATLGAVLMALKKAGISSDQTIVDRMRSSWASLEAC